MRLKKEGSNLLYSYMEFIQLDGVKVQVITLNGLEDSNAAEESKLLTPCSWKSILESHGKRNYIP